MLSIPEKICGRVVISSDRKYERTGSGRARRIYVWQRMYRSDICI